jgi:methionyl-tRNA formyltransferase
MKYLVAAGAQWGIDAYAKRPAIGDWALACTPEGLRIALQHQPRYVFCLNWSHKIAGPLVARHEFVNFHCTSLPFGRGGHPIENLILRGYTETIITAHRMTDELDAGPVYGTWGPISLAGTKAQICERFVRPVATMMRWIVEDEPDPEPQVGEPVRFARLSSDAYQDLWGARGR